MFEKTSQRVGFVIGNVLLIVATLSALMHFAAANWIEGVFGTMVWYMLVALFWHLTGVLKPVATWILRGK